MSADWDIWATAQGHLVNVGMRDSAMLKALEVDPEDFSDPALRKAVTYLLTRENDDFDVARECLGDEVFREVCLAVIASIASVENAKTWAKVCRRSAESFRAEQAARNRLRRARR